MFVGLKLFRMKKWIIILLVSLISSSWSFPLITSDPNPVVRHLPVMNVNVYMMGRQDVDAKVTIKINENIEYLNEAFKGFIKFNFNELFMDPNHAYLPDLYKKFGTKTTEPIVEPLINQIEKEGSINIYLFDTYCEEGTNAALMGFTPLLRAKQQSYLSLSPKFDRILMAYEGLQENKTLVHEMGHFFGLKHPWEMTIAAKYQLGIKNDTDEVKNHMSYGHEVEEFTNQQLEFMRQNALRYRSYLMDRIVKVYAKA